MPEAVAYSPEDIVRLCRMASAALAHLAAWIVQEGQTAQERPAGGLESTNGSPDSPE